MLDKTEFYKNILNKMKATVHFTKADGTLREMTCTRNVSLMPKEEQDRIALNEGTAKNRKESDDCVNVFDLDKNAWRAFKPSTVVEFKPEEDLQ